MCVSHGLTQAFSIAEIRLALVPKMLMAMYSSGAMILSVWPTG